MSHGVPGRDDSFRAVKQNLTLEECDERISGVYDQITTRLGKSTFWKVFTLATGLVIALGGALWGVALSHNMNTEAHIDPRYPPVTKEVFEDFRTEQRQFNKKQDKRYVELIRAINDSNGD